jgi:hypothetical protein
MGGIAPRGRKDVALVSPWGILSLMNENGLQNADSAERLVFQCEITTRNGVNQFFMEVQNL